MTLAAEKGSRQREIFIYFSVDMCGVYSNHERLLDDNCSLVLRFMEQLDKIYEQFIAARMRYDKQNKILELQQNSVETWLNSLCKQIKQPYHISLQQTQAGLYVLLPNDSYLNIAIPYKKFQELIPEIPSIVQNYVDLQESGQTNILLYKRMKNVDWEWTQPGDNVAQTDLNHE
jgi:hypothetical protein